MAIAKGIDITKFIEDAIREKIDQEKDHQIQT